MHKLIKLFNDNRAIPREYRAESDGDQATIYLYDAIGGFFGVDDEAFVRDLHALDAPVINLRINSPGGDVFAARAMATAIAQHPSRIVAHIDGLAASAATYVAISSAEVRMSKGAFFMIHNAWTLAIGNKDDLLSTASLLEKIDGTIADDYASKTSEERAQIIQWMDDETWFTAEEAESHGFVDAVIEDSRQRNNQWNLSAYAHVPTALQPKNPAQNSAEQHRAELLRRLQMLNAIAD